MDRKFIKLFDILNLNLNRKLSCNLRGYCPVDIQKSGRGL